MNLIPKHLSRVIFWIFVYSALDYQPCSSQDIYDYILCHNIKIYSENTNKSLTACLITEKQLLETFGKPDKTLFYDTPIKSKEFMYGGNAFEYDYDFDSPFDIRINRPTIKLIIQDTIEVNINASIEKILKCFPKSVTNQQDSESGIKDLIFYVVSKADLLNSEWGYSFLIISYIPETNAIYKIHQFVRD
jgi:hypothetical protein